MTTSHSNELEDRGLTVLHSEGDFIVVLDVLTNQGDHNDGVRGYRLINTRTWVCEGECLQEAMAIMAMRNSSGSLAMVLANEEKEPEGEGGDEDDPIFPDFNDPTQIPPTH